MPVIRSHSFRGVDSPHRDPLSPALSRQKSVPTTPTRRLKQNAENLPPNTAPALLKTDGFSSPSFSKPPIPKSSVKANGSLNSPGLPPRPPSAKPSPSANRVHGNQETSGNAIRKLSWDVQNNSNVFQEHISAVCSKVSENNTSDTGVQVMVRIKPLNKKEQNEEAERIIIKTSPNTFCMSDQQYTFDAVAGEDASQEQIFQTMGMPMVENCLQGFNSSIFAYGQTGSGKTYTMWGTIDDPSNGSAPKEQRGLTPRVFEKLFERTKQEEKKHCTKQLRYQCRCSFLEIYNEQIMDLLQPSLKNLQIREDTKTGVYVDNLTEEYVSNVEDVSRLLLKGMSNRRVGSTSMNTESSRSHCVFTCILECRYKSMADGMSSIRSSRINLVDLAGSERQKQTAAAGERLKEAGSINRSLSQLGNLINILAEVAQTGKQRHIPYRDSRLTFLLQESLGGNAKLAMICAVSPANSCKSETQSTLRFAQRAKAIRNKAVINEETTTDANLLREQIRQLKEELMRMKSKEIQQTGTVGAYSNAWNARRSYNLLRFSLNHSVAPPTADSDTEEDMEIDDDDVDAAQSSSNKSVGVKKSIEGHLESPSSSCLRLDEDLRGPSNAEFKKQELITVVHPNIGSILEFAMESDGNDQIQDSVMLNEGIGGHLESPSSPCTRFGKDLVETTNAELKERELLRVVHSNLEPILECAMETDGNAQIQDSVVMKGVEGHVRSPSRPCIRIDGDLGEAITQEPKEKELVTVVHSNLEPILECAMETDENAQNQDSIMVKEGAEGHLETPSRPCIRVDEDLVGRTNAELHEKELVKMVHSILDPILECAMETVENGQIQDSAIGVEGDIESSSSPSTRMDEDLGETTNVELKEKLVVTVMHSNLETDGNAQIQDSVVVKEGHLESPPEEKELILEPIVECAMEPTGDAQIQESNMVQDIIGEVHIVDAEKRTECGPSADLKLERAMETDDIQDFAMLNEGIEGTLEFSSNEKDLTLEPIVECAKETVENAQIQDFAMVNERVEGHLESASKEKDSILEPILECAKETVEDAQIQAIVEVEENKESSSPAKSHPECAKEIDAAIEEAESPCGKSGDICKHELDDNSRDEQLQMENGVESKTQGKTNEQIHDSTMVLEAQEAGLSAESHPECLKEIHAEVEADCGFSRDTCENAMDELLSDDSRDEQQLRDTEFVKMEDEEGKTEGKRKRDNDELSEWAEREEEWVALFEELRAEAKAYKRQAIRRQRELEKERQHSEEMKEALYVAMDGHARLLEQYAELQEKHVGLLAKHRKIREGVADVKRMASKAGVRASHSKWLETQAAQIVALNLEREQERQAANEEIEGLRAQLRDTAEAVQAAGELLVRLKEAEEAVTFSQDTAALAEQEADAMRREIEKMKRRHATEIATLQQRLLEARLKKASACPMCVMAERVKFEFTEVDAETAQADLEAEEDAAAISAAPPDASNTVMWGTEHQQFYECQPLEDEAMQEWYMENDTCNLDCEGSFYE